MWTTSAPEGACQGHLQLQMLSLHPIKVKSTEGNIPDPFKSRLQRETDRAKEKKEQTVDRKECIMFISQDRGILDVSALTTATSSWQSGCVYITPLYKTQILNLIFLYFKSSHKYFIGNVYVYIRVSKLFLNVFERRVRVKIQ